MDESQDVEELDKQLEQMLEKADQLIDECHFRSSAQLSAETARLARSNGRLLPYIYGRFHQMWKAQYLLDFATEKECAIELIAVVEDEDRARAIQPDFSVPHFEQAQHWMTACLYENLADSTGMANGYNSDGMHQCISDGLQVCRRTGKLQCIACFREYASDCYYSADDLLMARNQCEALVARETGWSDRGDRRYFAASKVARIHLLEGRVEKALESIQQALKLIDIEGVHYKMHCRMRILSIMDTIHILAGLERINWSAAHPRGLPVNPVPEGEWPELEMFIALNDALEACCEGEAEKAINILTEWDRRLDPGKSVHVWFELRLRLVAAMILADRRAQATRVAEQLKQHAEKASDYLTIRRLNRLLDESIPAEPLATVEPFLSGLFADKTAAHAEPTPAPTTASTPTVPPEPAEAETSEPQEREQTEFQAMLMELMSEFVTAHEEPEKLEKVVQQFLAIQAGQTDGYEDAAMAIHLATIVAVNSKRVNDFWVWARQFETQYADEPSVLSMVAVMAQNLRDAPDSSLAEELSDDELIRRHQLILSMDRDRVGNHLRAGNFYLDIGNEGEAERCLARAFRLDRTCSPAASQLSNIYRHTDRPRDALEVLDICLREGAEDPDLAMEATTMALLVGQFEAALSYADLAENFSEEEFTWLNYYRSIAQIELGRQADALASIELEAGHQHENSLHLDILRACAHVDSGNLNEGQQWLAKVNQHRLTQADQLTFNALCRLFDMLWRRLAESALPANHAERIQFESTMVAAGLAPDEFFTRDLTNREEDEPDVHCFVVLLRQELNEDWKDSRGCLAGQEHWESYLAQWTVLAEDEEDAGERAKDWQQKCAGGLCEILQIDIESGPYRDSPGVVVQGMRWAMGPEEAEDGEED